MMVTITKTSHLLNSTMSPTDPAGQDRLPQIPVQSWLEFLYRLQIGRYDHTVVADFLNHNWHVSVYFAALYIILLVFGLKWMQNRESFNLRLCLAAWSGMLCLFSLMGSVAVWPETIRVASRDGFIATYCDNSYVRDNKVVYWYTVFILSKVAELVDTVFIVLRKQRLITLHWVHHVLTLIFSFYTYGDEVSTARWMVVMNFTIHTVMYGYYSLRALRVSIPRPVALAITTAQIAQMFFGLYFYSHILLGGLADTSSCRCTRRVSIYGFMLYLLFFYFFVRFFSDAYLKSPKAKTKHSTVSEKATRPVDSNGKSNDLNNNMLLVNSVHAKKAQ